MRKVIVLLPLCVLLLVAGCAYFPVSTQYRYNGTVDFSTLRAYDWLPAPSAGIEDKLNMDEVVETVRAEMEKKGISHSPSSPDFLIAVHGAVEEKVDYMKWGSSRRSGGVWDAYGNFSSVEYQPNIKRIVYVKGKLVIDFVDKETNELIWRGLVTATLNPKEASEERTVRVREAVVTVLGKFPPPQVRERDETVESPSPSS